MSYDHCAVWLRPDGDWLARDQRYFKFLGPWVEHVDFQSQVKNAWRTDDPWNTNVSRLTACLTHWNRHTYRNIFKWKRRLLGRMEGIDRTLLVHPNERLSQLKKDLWTEYNSMLDQEEAFWFQQARSQWIRLGDRNTRYFHQKALIRRRGNKIETLLNEHDEWVYSDHDIQQALIAYFKSLFNSNISAFQPFHTNTSFPPIECHDLQVLASLVTLEEVKHALFSMENYKAPRSDGLHPLFFKSQWDVVGPSMFNFVQHVFTSPTAIGDINHTLLTLIPKVNEPSKPSDFRPIALCNVIYKIVTKILANRIKPLLPYIISPNQSSFISGRNAIDNALILQEVVHSMHTMGGWKWFMVVKLDLAKAYDKMEWCFIMDALERPSFPPHITDLISACLLSPSFSINWHGRQSNRFFSLRGL